MKRKLIPARLPSASGFMPASQRAAPRPAAPFGLFPSRVVDDRYVDMEQPGQLFILQPAGPDPDTDGYPLRVPPATVVTTQMNMPAGWDHFVLFQSGFAELTTTRIPSDTFAISVRMRDLSSAYLQFDKEDFAPFSGVFGFNGRPKQLAMPWVIPANATIQIDIRNETTAATYDVFMHFHAVRKAALH